MIACGIELSGAKAIFVVLEKKGETINDITGKFNQLVLKNDESCDDVRSFSETVSSHFDNLNPDRIALVKRIKSGPYAAGAITFKLEGIVQIYNKKNIELVASATLRKFQKDNEPLIKPKYKYQENAYLLALYLLE